MSLILNYNSGEKILLTLWVGGLWAIGYLAVPLLFARLEDRQLAGELAGHMFTMVSYLGLVCGGLLLLGGLIRSAHILTDKRFWILVLMIILVVIGEYVLQPLMAELKSAGLVAGSAEMQKFDRIHHAASTLYMTNSLLGLALIVFEQPARERS